MPTSQQLRAKHAALEYLKPTYSILAEERGRRTRRVSPPVVGVGIGNNNLRVYTQDVEHARHAVLDEFEGVRTFLIHTSGFHATPPIPSPPRGVAGTPCGVSVGHVDVSAGTIGCLVERDNEIFILSNNHVLADENRASIGDSIVQPGPIDGGVSPRDDVAELTEYRPLDFAGTNFVDAAIAELDDPDLVTPDIAVIGYPAPTSVPAFVGQQVCKHGRTTGFTTGIVVDESFDGFVTYTQGRAWFENQVVVQNRSKPFSLGGDSGSLIVNEDFLEPVALLFAGDGAMTLANPIDEVLDEFNVTIVNG